MLGEFNTHGAEQKRKAANNQLYKFEKIYEGTSTRKKNRGHKGESIAIGNKRLLMDLFFYDLLTLCGLFIAKLYNKL